MKLNENNEIWTIGHSTRTFKEFLAMLNSFKIKQLIDVRSLPGSRKFPHSNKDVLQITLPKNEIRYEHFENLGGRRKAKPDSKNTTWRNASFMGYADYMESTDFKVGLHKLQEIATDKRTAIMCSEAVWWRCHRSMISDALKAEGWKVMHIMGVNKAQEHPYTQPARIVNGTLNYYEI